MTRDDVHHALASHLLYGLNLAYPDVDETHLRRVDMRVGAHQSLAMWDVEVCCHGLGFTLTIRGECPLATALAVAERVVPVLEREMCGEVVN